MSFESQRILCKQFGCFAIILHNKFNIISHLLALLRCHLIFGVTMSSSSSSSHPFYLTSFTHHCNQSSRMRIEYESKFDVVYIQHIKCLFQFSSFKIADILLPSIPVSHKRLLSKINEKKNHHRIKSRRQQANIWNHFWQNI